MGGTAPISTCPYIVVDLSLPRKAPTYYYKYGKITLLYSHRISFFFRTMVILDWYYILIGGITGVKLQLCNNLDSDIKYVQLIYK